MAASCPAGASAQQVTTIANLGGADNGPIGSVITGPGGALFGTAFNSNAFFSLTPVKSTWKLKTILDFPASLGSGPNGTLVADAAGNMYGTTDTGGTHNCGTVYELKAPPAGKKKWTPVVLANLQDYPTDGCHPYGALVLAANGDLFGTTFGGGTGRHGSVFELMPPAAGSKNWTEKLLWSFTGAPDGDSPYAGVVWNAATSTLYGTTPQGGANHAGSVFALTQGTGGAWTESVIWSFTDSGADGRNPYAPVILGPNGSIFGSTFDGGNCTNGSNDSGWGIVFQLTPPTGGATSWAESVPFCLAGGNNGREIGALTLDSAGNLFFPTDWGLSGQGPFIYRISPVGGGAYQATILASFPHSSTGDGDPILNGPLTPDAAGNLYGTTGRGGSGLSGTVFKLSGSGYQP